MFDVIVDANYHYRLLHSSKSIKKNGNFTIGRRKNTELATASQWASLENVWRAPLPL